MPNLSFEAIPFAYICLSVVCMLCALTDIFVVGRRQHMKIMNAVWPLTMLYWGPVGLVAYFWFGREMSPAARQGYSGAGHQHHMEKPMWQACFTGASHCGAGCALGDFAGDWIAFAIGATVLGSAFAATLLIAFVIAYLFGIVFQYFTVVPMRGLSFSEGLPAAIKIDTLSLLAYEVGMFAWMGFRTWKYPELEPTQWSYWFMMQIAMMAAFITTYPVNWWLIRMGIKEKM